MTCSRQAKSLRSANKPDGVPRPHSSPGLDQPGRGVAKVDGTAGVKHVLRAGPLLLRRPPQVALERSRVGKAVPIFLLPRGPAALGLGSPER